jgi:hypothetical protein
MILITVALFYCKLPSSITPILSWFRQHICHRGRCMAVCGRGEHGGAIQDGGSTSLPSFRSRDGGEILRAAIIHYMATSARLQ